MKLGFSTSLILSASLAMAAVGCQRKVDAGVELEKAAQTFAPVQQNSPAAPATAAATPAQAMNNAVATYRSGDLPAAVVELQKLRAAPAISPQQRIALNDAMAAVMTDIYARAAKGDARAIEAVKRAEQLQNQ